MTERALGRLPATDDRHLQRWSLTAETMPSKPTPVVLGINWHEGFDGPNLIRDGHGATWITDDVSRWGRVRGGHAICVKPPRTEDTLGWWRFYDQGNEGACVGFASSRMMTLLNRARYDAPWLYHEAQRIDEWDGEDYEGTSVRAGMDVLRKKGHCRYSSTRVMDIRAQDGIQENRWARSIADIAACLDPATGGSRVLNVGYVTLLNSWGTDYPHGVRLSLESLRRLVLEQGGEATVVVDRP